MPSEVNPRGPQFLCAFAILREEKILLGGRVRRPAILRGRLQRRQAAKASGSQTEPTTISLRLCAFARIKKKKKNMAPRNSSGQAAKTPSRKVRRGGRQTGWYPWI